VEELPPDSGRIRVLTVLAGYRRFSAHAKVILHQLSLAT
jgi:hypothetical protein